VVADFNPFTGTVRFAGAKIDALDIVSGYSAAFFGYVATYLSINSKLYWLLPDISWFVLPQTLQRGLCEQSDLAVSHHVSRPLSHETLTRRFASHRHMPYLFSLFPLCISPVSA